MQFVQSPIRAANNDSNLDKIRTWRLTLVKCLILLVTFSVVAFPSPVLDSGVMVLAQDAAAGGGGGAAATTPAEEESLLGWLAGSLGWLYMIVFLGLSFILVALFIMNVLSARREYVCPQHLVCLLYTSDAADE